MAKIPYQVFSSAQREDAMRATGEGYVVVYNQGMAIRELDEEGHSIPIGHFGDLPEGNEILDRLVEGGFVSLVSGSSEPPKKKAAPKKKVEKEELPASSEKKSGFKEDARDGDGDGMVQDGTEWERPA